MKAPITVSFEAVFEAVSVGLLVVDHSSRVVAMNRAFRESLALPLDAFPPGTAVGDAGAGLAASDLDASADPSAPVRPALAGDLGRFGRSYHHAFAGRSFDLLTTTLPDGGYIVSAIETTDLLGAQADSTGALARMTAGLAALRVGVAIFNPSRRLLFANPRFAGVLGMPSEHLVAGLTQKAMLSLLETRGVFVASVASAGDSGCLASLREALPRAPGRSRYQRSDGQVVEVMFDPLTDGGYAVSVLEATSGAHASDEETRRARLLDQVLLNVPHGICVYGPDHRVALFNDAYNVVMAGAPLNIGDSLVEVIRRRAEAGEYGEGEPEAIIAIQMAHNIAHPQSRRRLRPNGKAIDIRTAPLPDGGHISVVTDISALVQAEAEVRQRAGEMSTMLSNARHGIMLWSSDRHLVASNPVAATLLDLPADLLTPGRTETDVVEALGRLGHFGSAGTDAPQARRLLQLDRSVPFEREITTLSGRILHAQSNPAPSGGWISTFTDITQMRQTESELRREKERAEAANEAKSRFLATMSHELRTPLNAIIGYSDALTSEGDAITAELVADYSGQINAAGKQLLSLINIILDVARIESGRFEPNAEIADIGNSVAVAVRQTHSAALAGEITIKLKLPDDLPWLRGDERRITEALSQLLSNAVKFTKGGGVVTVEAGLTPETDLFVSVADTGIGIPETELERVFEPFTQLDGSLSRRYGGTGLGLFSARAIVVAHGGQLHLTSRLGVGTTVRMILPRNRILCQAEP